MDYLGVVLLVAVVAAAFVVIARSSIGQGHRARAERARQLVLAKRAAEADVNGFGDELSQLSILGEQDAAAADLYELATALHHRALEALIAARRPDDLCQVTEILEEGRWTLTRLTAWTAGQPTPSRRPPCFFNPGHGPSTRNIVWQHRSVPACAADATRVEAGADPYIRTVERDDRRVPYWEGGPTYDGWARGYYTSWRGNRLVADIVPSKV
ncbi:MAG: hypothetical protein QM582_06770 [Micropruina sp.]|uniref:hypothetical protein n=1 Tax=Micropruina sp. TaxID=2737536 RepID=UPI0039E50793